MRVLVVDDNIDAAETLAEFVQLLGHEALVVHDGPAALKAAAEFAPLLVLLDIGLPGMDGYAVALALRSTLPPAARLVALSGYDQDDARRRSAAAGFDLHLAKPVDPTRLESLLADPSHRS